MSVFKQIYSFAKKNSQFWIILSLVLVVPALFINLGLMPFTSDEPTRGIVALEMLFSGNFVAPTLKGDLYFNKPPLYNYLIAAIFSISQKSPELLLRLPAVLMLIGFMINVQRFTKRYFDSKTGWAVALMFVTCGRLLFWDSMLGLIDICFSWLTFISFTIIIKEIKTGKYLKLFLLTYLITAAGVLMKGIPSLAFQSITLLTMFIHTRKFKILFSWQHFLGIGLFLAIVSIYFLSYSKFNSLGVYFETLWSQSSQRTPAEHNIFTTIKHLSFFHFEMIYHFLPWSMFAILLLGRGSLKKIRKSSIIWPLTLIFIFNIIIYWLSPDTRPRYLIMLIPVTFIIFIFLWNRRNEMQRWLVTLLQVLMFYLLPLIITAGIISTLFIDNFNNIENLIYIVASLGLVSIILTIFSFVLRNNRIFVIVSLLLVFRIAFNFIFLPNKTDNMWEQQLKLKAHDVADITKGSELEILNRSIVDHVTVLYLELERQETLIMQRETPKKDVYYLANVKYLEHYGLSLEEDVTIHYELFAKHKYTPLYLVTLK